ncbi:MAG: glycosyltransferase [Kiritimatiellae bacterium]|nr:glycosyltransferase [Kiritimatiellia bacterium]
MWAFGLYVARPFLYLCCVQEFDPDSSAYAESHAPLCAYVKWSRPQRRVFAAGLGLLAAACALRPYATWLAVTYALAVFFFCVLGIRLAAILACLFRDPAIRVAPDETAALAEDDLPPYSVLVPLYQEPEVVPSLVEALDALDYPREKLDIQLLVEPADRATIDALEKRPLPGHMRITRSPGGLPQTKPRACNTGLREAQGEFLVVFDAEDRPEPDQLKKAVAAYRTLPEAVVCLQARLDHYNSLQSLFAQWSAMEYLVWFRLFLPGLQRLGAPIPLGGTSNHFRTRALRELGGWDPFNVTEDCDLGMRIARRGWSTRMLASTTWEEAVVSLRAWLRQRTRWIKGYWQTWLVQTRRGSLREFGLRKWLFFMVLIGGSACMLTLNPLMWGIIAAWFCVGWSLVNFTSALSVLALAISLVLLAANAVFVLINVAGCLACRRPDLLCAALLCPVEWGLLSLSAWRAGWQFFTRPFQWEKTAHGHAVTDAAARGRRHWALRTAMPAVSCLLAVLALGLLTAIVVTRVKEQARAQIAVQRPPLFAPDAYRDAVILCAPGTRAQEPGRAAAVVSGVASNGQDALLLSAAFPGETAARWEPAADWSAWAGLSVRLLVPDPAPRGIRVLFHLRDRDSLWYQHLSPQELLPGRWTRVDAAFNAARADWAPCNHGKPLDDYSLQQITEFGVRVFAPCSYRGPVYAEPVRGIPLAPAQRARLHVTERHAHAATVAQFERFELTFDVGKAYRNPFDPRVVDIWAHFLDPTGDVLRVPAFFYQAFDRRLERGREVLTPVGPGVWKVRFTPVLAGAYRCQLVLRDEDGANLRTPARTFRVVPAAHDGFVRVSARNPRYLAFDSGRFYYPLGHNLCTPVDSMKPFPYSFALPEGQGTYAYDRYLEQMAAHGENWARVWMTPWWVGLEGRAGWPGFHGMGRYNLANAWRLDYLLDLAARKQIRVQLTSQHYSEYDPRKSWPYNPYNQALGGPIARPEAFFSDPAARTAYRNRLRYIVARWGYSPHILAWELWGEVNLVPGYNPRAGVAWHREMAQYLDRIDPWDHLVFTHCHNWQKGHELWALPEIECVQGNGYIRPPNRTANHVVNFARYLDEVRRYAKPVFVAEYGGRSERGAPSADYLEAQLHSGLWASFAAPFAGTAMHWWWNFIDGENLYPHYRALARFAQGIDRLAADYRPAPAFVRGAGPHRLEAVGLRAQGRVQPDDLSAIARGATAEAAPLRPAPRPAAHPGAVVAVYWVYHTKVFETLKDIPRVEAAALIATGFEPGEYGVECWDTYAGTVIRKDKHTANGTLAIPLPPIDRDVAVKVYSEEEEGTDR